jgi:taurine dioxygenase
MASFESTPLASQIGAEIHGVDVSKPVDDRLFGEIQQALFQHQVIVFRDQRFAPPEQIAFARRFGDLDVHPIANGMADYPEMIRVWKPKGERAFFGTSWHTDNTFFEKPSAAVILFGDTIPPVGGDTLYASMGAAYEALSPKMQSFVKGLTAVHSAARAYDPKTTGDAKYKGEAAITYTFSDSIYDEVEHPVVRTHPETGRLGLFVNPMFTLRIKELETDESEALLAFLYAHATRPELTCRVRWQPGSLVIWDNRCTQHYAIDDYPDYERVMYRVTVSGSKPF